MVAVDRFARIEAARISRESTEPKAPITPKQREPHFGTKAKRAWLTAPRVRYSFGDYAVVAEYDDGRPETVMYKGMSWEAAEELAGHMRDRMTEQQCEEFNYVAKRISRR
jgi:hypothetical protein